MPKADILDMTGGKVKEIQLEDAVWSVEANDQILCEYIRYHSVAGRKDTAKTKTKDEVRGGGAKPWRQKGTGRARHGSNRSPIWTGGGVTFGPDGNRNYSKGMNRKLRRKALAAILSIKLADDKVRFVDSIAMQSRSTKAFVKFLADCKVEGAALVISAEPDIDMLYSARNLPKVKVIHSDRINPHDLLKYEYLIMDSGAREALEKGMGE